MGTVRGAEDGHAESLALAQEPHGAVPFKMISRYI